MKISLTTPPIAPSPNEVPANHIIWSVIHTTLWKINYSNKLNKKLIKSLSVIYRIPSGGMQCNITVCQEIGSIFWSNHENVTAPLVVRPQAIFRWMLWTTMACIVKNSAARVGGSEVRQVHRLNCKIKVFIVFCIVISLNDHPSSWWVMYKKPKVYK